MSEIPVELCIGGRDLTEPRLAPGGGRIGWIVAEAGSARIAVRDIGEGADTTVRTLETTPEPRPGRGLGGGCWCWCPSGEALVYAGVDGNLWRVALDGSPSQRLTDVGPERAAQAPMVGPDRRCVVYVVDQAEVWLIRLPPPDAVGDDLVGSVVPVRLDDGSADFCFDPWILPGGRRVQWLAWSVPDMPWDHATVVAVDLADDVDAAEAVVGRQVIAAPDGAAIQQPRATPDGRPVWLRDDHGYMNVWLGDEPVVEEPFEHGGPTWGLGQRSFAVSPDGLRIAFTRNEEGFGRLAVAAVPGEGSSPFGGAPAQAGRGVHGQLSWEANRLAALRTGARTPTEVVVYDTTEADPAAWPREVIDVGPTAAWSGEESVEPQEVTVETPDGSVLFARLFAADDPDGRLIVWLHGGPTDQWQVTFMPRIAYWRSRGWSVLVPDHRGSTGHGRAYQQALHGRWGELDVADTAAWIASAHERGWGDAASTALFGGSAGGFTVLGVLAAHPDLAAAAAVAYPVSDLADLAERSHRFERHYTWSLVGPPPGPDERVAGHPYVDRSPVWFADRISTPLLVFHGDLDPVVPIDQSRVLVERIKAAGHDAELVVYEGEGHGFRSPEHQLDEYRRTGEFLARHIPHAPSIAR